MSIRKLPAAPSTLPPALARGRQKAAEAIAMMMPAAMNTAGREAEGDPETVEFLRSLKGAAKDLQNLSHERGEIRNRLQALEQRVAEGGGGGGGGDYSARLNVSALFENPAFDDIRRGVKGSARQFEMGEISIKALISLDPDNPSSGHTTYPGVPQYLGGRLGAPLAPLRLLDVLPSRPVTTRTIEYTRLTSTGDAQVQEGEGEEKAESEFEGELVTASIATIAVHTTASAQVLDDSVSLQETIERVLANKVQTSMETQLITGSGTGFNIEGLYTAATAINPLENNVPDRIGSALTTMETAGYAPNVILMNPADWFAVKIMKDQEGNYLFGDPSAPVPPSLWNRPVITSPKIPLGHALVGDTSHVTVLDRMQPTVFISRDHKDYRTRNLVLILVEARLGLALYDANGFRKIDLGQMSA